MQVKEEEGAEHAVLVPRPGSPLCRIRGVAERPAVELVGGEGADLSRGREGEGGVGEAVWGVVARQRSWGSPTVKLVGRKLGSVEALSRVEFTFAYVSDPKRITMAEAEASISPAHGAFSCMHDRSTSKSEVFQEVRMNRFLARVLFFMPFTSGCMRY